MQAHSENTPVGRSLSAKLRRWKLPLVLFLVLLAGGGYFAYRYTASNGKANYLAVAVGKEDIADVIEANGIIEPVRTVGVNFKNVGLVKALYVREGDRVKAGQLLAEQDTSELEAELKQAESNLKRSEAELQQLISGSRPEEIAQKEAEVEANQVAYEMAEKELERQQKLFEAGAAPASDVDTAKKALISAKSQLEQSQQALKLLKEGSRAEEIEAARAAVQAAEATLEVARLNLAEAKIYAPFDGIVTAVNGDVGQRSGTGGTNVDTSFITLASEELQLRAWVNEADIGKVKLGQEVEFTVAAYSDVTFKGKVKTIAPEATTKSNVQIFEVLISVEDPSNLLRSGMSATATIVLAKKSDVLAVPTMALTFAESYLKGQGQTKVGAAGQLGAAGKQAGEGNNREGDSTQGGQTAAQPQAQAPGQGETTAVAGDNTKTVLVLENGQPVARKIKVGLSDGQYVEVLEGLTEGEKVIIGMITGKQSQQSTTSSQTQRSGQTQQRSSGSRAGGLPPGPPL
ncbi:MAG: efflux RND transporter periplasmic adaptor subunit [Moorellaceae bacterium]